MKFISLRDAMEYHGTGPDYLNPPRKRTHATTGSRELTPGQQTVLDLIVQRGTASRVDIALAMGLPEQHIVNQLKSLQKRGLIERVPVESGPSQFRAVNMGE